MIIIMDPLSGNRQVCDIVEKLGQEGLRPIVTSNSDCTIIITATKGNYIKYCSIVESWPGVKSVTEINQQLKLSSRIFKQEDTVVDVNGVKIGDDNIIMMAGPCAVESKEQLLETAKIVKAGGASVLRGGAYKPRTSPYAFHGLQEEGLKMLSEAKRITGLPIITEATDQISLPVVAQYTDILQIGARNMYNYSLLQQAAGYNKPILLKRSPSATIEDWLLAAEYILLEGNFNVILCERGICGFDNYTRNVLDLTAVPVVKSLSHLPVVVDPSHAIGKREYIPMMAAAAVAAGADGLLIEVHNNPEKALCDGQQSLTPEGFKETVNKVKAIAGAIGKSFYNYQQTKI